MDSVVQFFSMDGEGSLHYATLDRSRRHVGPTSFKNVIQNGLERSNPSRNRPAIIKDGAIHCNIAEFAAKITVSVRLILLLLFRKYP